MSTTYKPGFTIIETMLFLAVTGLLVVSILAGTGVSINIQRYRDSVTSLQTMLQDQYSEVINVRNEVPDQSVACDTNAVVTTNPGPPSARGQADCVILGRLISTLDNKTLTLSTVVGYISSTVATGSDDVATLKLYKLNILPTSSQNYSIEWGSALVKPGGDDPLAFSALIVRSPSSGVIRTFVSPDAVVSTNSLASLIESANLIQPLKACVDAGGLFGTNKMAVSIVAGATGPTGIEVLGDGSSGC